MPLEPGSRLGTFEILGPLGAGGMGEVYRARDTKLGREVAIKVLPEAFSRDPMRVSRFEREARMLASINHPAIAAIYGAEESGQIRYIVMELVPGDTLSARMTRGALPIEESLQIARQIAEALEAAHERGVIHRDLKPANIKVTPEGRIKVLDLGLAKFMEEPREQQDLSNSPTLTEREQTRPGVILGTVEFMSPEQARGKEVDKRTDIWAFGCILFEMLSGRRAFTGETVSDVLAAILKNEPAWEELPLNTPPRIRELLSRCLQKDAAKRLRDIGDARMEVEKTLEGDKGASPAPPPSRTASRFRPVAIALALLIFAGALFLLLRSREKPPAAVEASKSLVVLPVKMLSDAPGGQLVGDGLADMLSARLYQVRGIQVVTPTAALAAADKNKDPFAAARSVGGDLVFNSSLIQSGDRLRIIYSVWNVQTRAQVDGDTVDGSASDIFAVQDKLVDRVAAGLKLPKPSKKTPTPSGLETASEQQRYVEALGRLQRYDQQASLDAAIRLLEALSKERTESAIVQAALARAYLDKLSITRDRSWADKAARASGRAQELNPDLPEVDVTIGALRTEIGQPREAVAAFRRALSIQPNNFEALLGLARANADAGQTSEAEATYKRAIALQPSYWGGYSKLAGFYSSTGNYAASAEMFRRVTELSPDNARAFANLGGAYQLKGDFGRALSAYEKSLSLEPTNAAYSNLGTTQFFLGHYKEATESFEAALRLSPNYYQLWSNLGDAYRWTPGLETKAPDAYKKAIELAREELRSNPHDAIVHSYLALCLAKTGRLDEARVHSREAVLAGATNPEVLYNAAIVAALDKQPKEALGQIRSAAAAGYPAAFILREPEFASLRNEKAFLEITQSVRKQTL